MKGGKGQAPAWGKGKGKGKGAMMEDDDDDDLYYEGKGKGKGGKGAPMDEDEEEEEEGQAGFEGVAGRVRALEVPRHPDPTPPPTQRLRGEVGHMAKSTWAFDQGIPVPAAPQKGLSTEECCSSPGHKLFDT